MQRSSTLPFLQPPTDLLSEPASEPESQTHGGFPSSTTSLPSFDDDLPPSYSPEGPGPPLSPPSSPTLPFSFTSPRPVQWTETDASPRKIPSSAALSPPRPRWPTNRRALARPTLSRCHSSPSRPQPGIDIAAARSVSRAPPNLHRQVLQPTSVAVVGVLEKRRGRERQPLRQFSFASSRPPPELLLLATALPRPARSMSSLGLHPLNLFSPALQ